MKILVVIPARGGSKGVPKKNVREIAGKPLIAYAIQAALGASDCFSNLIVSTDSREIAEIAQQYGADVPFMRPAEFATDTATSLSVLQHALTQIEERDATRFDWVLLIQPTNPLVLAEDIRAIVEIAKSHPQATSVVSVCSADNTHPLKIKVIEDGFLKPFLADALETIRRQDIAQKVYKRNGSLYMTRRDVLMDENDLYGDKILPYEMPPQRSIDIDTEHDCILAEFLLLKQRGV